ncbi:MAG: hypothetical protein L0I76_18985 [Pseudonocardia sp.]|nr:hypothetical protein [Pseudonocardia sp.]
MAREVEGLLTGLRVRAVPGGWTVSGRTGRVVVARTLDELLAAGAGEPDREAMRAAALAAADEAS